MKRTISLVLAAVLLAGLVLLSLAGCGTETVKIGDTEIETKDGETTVKTEDGETTLSTKMITEAEAGVPIYPNAKMDENTVLSTTNAAGQKQVIAASLWTDDPTDEVIAWYKSKLAGKPEYNEMPVTEGGVNEIVIAFKDGDTYRMVTIGADKVDHPGKTAIGIASNPTVP